MVSINMANHPNRSNQKKNSPTPQEVKELRESLKLTQTQAAEVIYCSLRGWQQWEEGVRKMHPAFWELFKIKTMLNTK